MPRKHTLFGKWFTDYLRTRTPNEQIVVEAIAEKAWNAALDKVIEGLHAEDFGLCYEGEMCGNIKEMEELIKRLRCESL